MAPREVSERAARGILPSTTQPSLSPPLSSSSHASLAGHLRENVEDADKVIRKGGHPTGPGHSWCVSHPSSVTTLHPSPFYTPHGLPPSGSQLSNSSTPNFVSLGSKRSLDSQMDIPEPKRRRTARKRSLPPASETEVAQPLPGPSPPTDNESELAALKRTLQQVQEDLSALQQDQRQLDDMTRGIQHDLDEAQPRDTLRFLEEHFTCAL